MENLWECECEHCKIWRAANRMVMALMKAASEGVPEAAIKEAASSLPPEIWDHVRDGNEAMREHVGAEWLDAFAAAGGRAVGVPPDGEA